MNGLIRLEDAIKAINDAPCHSESIRATFRCAISALEQEPCEKQIKIGTKVRTTKDKDFFCEEVFPVGTIGIVERIDKGDNLPYKIVANNDFYYYSRDMFEIIEDVEPCDDAISRDAVDKYIARLLSGYLYDGERERLEIFSAYLWELPSVTQKSEHFIDGVHAMGYREGYKDAQKQKSGKWINKDVRKEEYVLTGKCSVCGQVRVKDKYCPNCGAKMESEDKE